MLYQEQWSMTFPLATSFKEPHLLALSQALDFTPNDLAQNRRGYPSERQIEIIKMHIDRTYSYAANMLWMALGVSVALWSLNWIDGGSCFLVFGIVPSFFLLVLKYEQRQVSEELPKCSVTHCDLHLAAITKHAGQVGLWSALHIGSGIPISVPRSLFKELHPYLIYEGYYLELVTMFRAKRYTLLSIEPTTEWVNKPKRKKKQSSHFPG